MYLYSKAWVVETLKELGGEAPLDLLRRLSVSYYKYRVLDCLFPEQVGSTLSCIEGALRSLEKEGIIEIKDGKVKLLGSLAPSLISR